MRSPLDAVVAVAGAVPGVAEVTVEPAGGGAPALRVHLLPGADGATAALALGRLLAGLEDPSAALAPRRPATPAPRRAGRPVIERLDVHSDGTSSRVRVALSCAGRTASGSARALTGTGGRRAVAAATLRAVEGLLPQPAHLELEHVQLGEDGEQSVALVHVNLVCAAVRQRLVGSAVIREDEASAFLRAALDAVNRRVEALVQTS